MQKILIVDDQRDVRAMLRAGLQTLSRPATIIDVPSGEEAMLVISGQTFDLLIIDVRLPGISGLELRRRAAQMNPDLKLIIITGVVDPHVRQQVISSGADAFFWKPISMADFLPAVEQLLGGTAVAPPRPGTGSLGQHAVHDLRGLLETFNSETGSQASLVFTNRRKVLARAGEFPLVDESGLLAVFVKLLQVGASAASPLGSVRLEPVHYFHAPGCDFYLAPLDDHRSFVSVTTPSSQALSLGEIIQAIMVRSPQFAAAMVEPKAAPSQAPEAEPKPQAPPEPSLIREPTPLTEEIFTRHVEKEPQVEIDAQLDAEGLPDTAELPTLEELFGEAALHPTEQTDAADFWDTLVEKSEESKVRPGDLTFEEAQKLGLGPDTL